MKDSSPDQSIEEAIRKSESARDLVSLSSQKIVGQRFAYEAIILMAARVSSEGVARLPTLTNKNAASHMGPAAHEGGRCIGGERGVLLLFVFICCGTDSGNNTKPEA